MGREDPSLEVAYLSWIPAQLTGKPIKKKLYDTELGECSLRECEPQKHSGTLEPINLPTARTERRSAGPLVRGEPLSYTPGSEGEAGPPRSVLIALAASRIAAARDGGRETRRGWLRVPLPAGGTLPGAGRACLRRRALLRRLPEVSAPPVFGTFANLRRLGRRQHGRTGKGQNTFHIFSSRRVFAWPCVLRTTCRGNGVGMASFLRRKRKQASRTREAKIAGSSYKFEKL
jgi:hypothetical protein